MNITVKEGNYLALGAQVNKNQITFTFEGEKEDVCGIVLIHKETKDREYISVSEEYCKGSLRSVTVTGIAPLEYTYLYEINGKEVLDPYATIVVGREIWNDASRKENKYKVSGGFLGAAFSWGEDKNPEIPKSEMMMYKLHVRGFTMGLKSAGKSKGTFLAVKNKIPYLKDLGITTVEFMPVYEFEEMPIPIEYEVPEYVKWQTEAEDKIIPVSVDKNTDKLNYWGYGEGNYYAVKSSYAYEPEKANIEFKRLVKALHENQMECVLEFFFPENTNHNKIMDILHFWVKEYHIDGFHLIGPSLPITSIVQDPLLSRTKIFAEDFYGQYNSSRHYKNLYIYKDEYLYPARQLLNHYDGDIREFANQQRKQSENYGFVNYLASNNGFTLADCFMYNDKHNEANGEDNRDGNDYNLSNNYGIEGPTKKKFINELRRNSVEMAFTMLLFAQGVPLIMAGDEFGNTQYGNNNAYCQDNEIGWVNWSQFAKYKEVREQLKELISFRKKHGIISKEEPFRFYDYRTTGAPEFSYHGENAWISQLDPGRRSLGMLYNGAYAKDGQCKDDVYVGYNFYSEDVKLALPTLKQKKWTLYNEVLEDQQYVVVPAHRIVVVKTIEEKNGKK